MPVVLVIFVASYGLIATGRVPGLGGGRAAAAAFGALAMVLAGAVGPVEAITQAINRDTLVLLAGMMLISDYLAEAQLFRYASWLTLTHVRSARGRRSCSSPECSPRSS